MRNWKTAYIPSSAQRIYGRITKRPEILCPGGTGRDRCGTGKQHISRPVPRGFTDALLSGRKYSARLVLGGIDAELE